MPRKLIIAVLGLVRYIDHHRKPYTASFLMCLIRAGKAIDVKGLSYSKAIQNLLVLKALHQGELTIFDNLPDR